MTFEDSQIEVEPTAPGSQRGADMEMPFRVPHFQTRAASFSRIMTVGANLSECCLPPLRRSSSHTLCKQFPPLLVRDEFGHQRRMPNSGNHAILEEWIPRAGSRRICIRDAEVAAAAVIASAGQPTPRLSNSVYAFVHTVAGVTGAVIALAVVYPLDSLRTIQSVRGGSALDVAKLHLASGGWRRLYRGLRAALAGVLFSWGTYFFVYTLAKRRSR